MMKYCRIYIWTILALIIFKAENSNAQQSLTDSIHVFVPATFACDSPLVDVVVKLVQPLSGLGKFRITLQYYNPSFYFNGNLTPNPAIDSLSVQYFIGDATDMLVVERKDSTPINLIEPWLFKFEANYFGGNNEIRFDTASFSPYYCFVENSAGQGYTTSYATGWVYPCVTGIEILPDVLGVVISPNPSDDGRFQVMVPEGDVVKSWSVWTIQGQRILTEFHEGIIGKGSFQMDLACFPKGIYFLSLSGRKDSRVFKLINN